MLVEATDLYQKMNLKDKELKRVPEKGETFEVTEERYKFLTKENKYKKAFVKKIETATPKVEVETAEMKTNDI